MSEPAADWRGRLTRITAVDTYRFGSMEDQIPAASAPASVHPATIFQKLKPRHLHIQRLPHDVPQVAAARPDIFEQGFQFHGIARAPRGGVEPRRPPHQGLHAGFSLRMAVLDHLVQGGQLLFQECLPAPVMA